ncbi:hypothetical protein [Bradyrhizobium sp. th.b2]|uniref:hypothetical protein n=1 Tax=Bradyrhizobium sp. th-b2 TaxID=172088 RepID=UPI00048B3BA9|nr:hypothetical protein [Bradyrhizobium sp. th.b2]
MSTLNQQYGYEELREIVVDILIGKEQVDEPTQWDNLTQAVATVIARRAGHNGPQAYRQAWCPQQAELVRDIFWDLFRQGFITLGLNHSNPAWPFFRLSHYGQKALKHQSPFRFHDTKSFVQLVMREAPDLSREAQEYLEEAVATFYAGCLLSSCVMLGVAAEAEFLRLVDVASNGKHATKFAAVPKPLFIRQKIGKFQAALTPLANTLPKEVTEDLDTNFTMVQSVLRVSRNEAGHPTAAKPEREQVYVFLQLFVPFARQAMRLRQALA